MCPLIFSFCHQKMARWNTAEAISLSRYFACMGLW